MLYASPRANLLCCKAVVVIVLALVDTQVCCWLRTEIKGPWVSMEEHTIKSTFHMFEITRVYILCSAIFNEVQKYNS